MAFMDLAFSGFTYFYDNFIFGNKKKLLNALVIKSKKKIMNDKVDNKRKKTFFLPCDEFNKSITKSRMGQAPLC